MDIGNTNVRISQENTVNRYSFVLLLALVLTATAEHAYSTVRRVNPDGTCTPIDGSTWCKGYRDLQSGIDDSSSGDEVWVKVGTYIPYDGCGGTCDEADHTERSTTFTLKEGVAVYGGFVGTETSEQDRDPTNNETILDGDLNGDDDHTGSGNPEAPDGGGNNATLGNNKENVYHVVSAVVDGADITDSTILDGFIIQNGRAEPTSGNYHADHVVGAGIRIIGDDTYRSSPQIKNCVIRWNWAREGAGAWIKNGSPRFIADVEDFNFRIQYNAASLGGSAIYLSDCAGLLLEGYSIDVPLDIENNYCCESLEGCGGYLLNCSGAIYMNSNENQVAGSNVCIVDNCSTSSGAGIYALSDSSLNWEQLYMITGNKLYDLYGEDDMYACTFDEQNTYGVFGINLSCD